MIRSTVILVFCLLTGAMANARPASSSAILQTNLKHKDFFRLNDNYSKVKADLDPWERLYYGAFIDNAFNRCRESTLAADTLLKVYSGQLNDTVKIALLKLQIDNDVKIYQYATAADKGDELISKYGNLMDAAALADLKNTNILWRALSGIPVQQTDLKTDTRISWKRDAANLMNIPVTTDQQTHDFVFDTGANISTISSSYARLLHLRLIETSFDLGSGTAITNKASLAIADHLAIGNIELKNVVFLVLPDEQLRFPQINYTIHGIIGYPVISQLGEIHVSQAGTMFIPAKMHNSALHNLAMDGLLPIISLRTDRDTLSYSFDTGAKQSELSGLYFNKYKTEIEQTAKTDSISRGGAGGTLRYKVYKLPEFHFYTGTKKINLPGIDVLTAPDGDKEEYYYGNIGQDLIGRFKEMVLNFKEMYIGFN